MGRAKGDKHFLHFSGGLTEDVSVFWHHIGAENRTWRQVVYEPHHKSRISAGEIPYLYARAALRVSGGTCLRHRRWSWMEVALPHPFLWYSLNLIQIMKAIITLLMLVVISCSSCVSEWVDPVETFTIRAGEHRSVNRVETLKNDVLDFDALFDESAVYKNQDPIQQYSKNKLMGFADRNSLHHENSARFGWNWIEGQLHVTAYCYVKGERKEEEIGVISLNEYHHFQIRLTNDAYVFTVDDYPAVHIKREVESGMGLYYMLWPYFGGEEVAPHDIHIKVRWNF